MYQPMYNVSQRRCINQTGKVILLLSLSTTWFKSSSSSLWSPSSPALSWFELLCQDFWSTYWLPSLSSTPFKSIFKVKPSSQVYHGMGQCVQLCRIDHFHCWVVKWRILPIPVWCPHPNLLRAGNLPILPLIKIGHLRLYQERCDCYQGNQNCTQSSARASLIYFRRTRSLEGSLSNIGGGPPKTRLLVGY